jgi:hypothetical protein
MLAEPEEEGVGRRRTGGGGGVAGCRPAGVGWRPGQ